MTAQDIANGLLDRYQTNRRSGLPAMDWLDPNPETLPALDYDLALIHMELGSDRAHGVYEE